MSARAPCRYGTEAVPVPRRHLCRLVFQAGTPSAPENGAVSRLVHKVAPSQLGRCARVYGSSVILPKDRDPVSSRSVAGGRSRTPTIGSSLCGRPRAPSTLHFFESVQPSDPRPRQAIEQIRAWTRGEIRMSESRAAGGHAMGAARALSGAARHAAYAAGQAAVVAHVTAHELGAAAYAIKAARAAALGMRGARRPARVPLAARTAPGCHPRPRP
jgi:hypothetical protein